MDRHDAARTMLIVSCPETGFVAGNPGTPMATRGHTGP
jgi:hypothetical protein